MTQHSEIFNPEFDKILEHVSRESNALGIDFYLAGAVARDYHLSKSDDYIPTRRTEDVDIAVMVSNEDEFCKLKTKLIESGYFEEHAEPIKLIYKKSIELDLLPFGSIEEAGITRLTMPKAFILEMPGFTLLNEHTEKVLWNNKVQTRICSIEGILLLKLIANDDRPGRIKDLTDIQLIIERYFDIFSNDIYNDHFDLMEHYDTKDRTYKQQICAHVIGRKLRDILNIDKPLFKRIINILNQDKDKFWINIKNGLSETG